MKIEHIIKRDFSTSPFQLDKITEAIQKAMDSVGVGNAQNAQDVALSVYKNDFYISQQFSFLCVARVCSELTKTITLNQKTRSKQPI